MLDCHTYGNMALVKTTVDLEAGLFKTARKLAIDQGRPFRAVLNDALRAYLHADAAGTAPRPNRRRRQAPTGAAAESRVAQPAGGGRAVTQAEFWAIVNNRSRWDEIFGDRLQEIESEIAAATAEWERRRRQ